MTTTVTPLDYDEVLTLEQARERLEEVRKAIDEVKRKYSGWLSRHKKSIAEEDNKLLGECVGVLLPLSMQRSVQGEIATSADYQNTVHAKCTEHQQEIMLFLARFKNTGVKVYRSDDSFQF